PYHGQPVPYPMQPGPYPGQPPGALPGSGPGFGGQQPAYGPPGSVPPPGFSGAHFGPGGQPPKSNKALWLVLGAVGLVVIVGVALALVFTLGGGSDPSTVAHNFVTALNNKDASAAQQLACEDKRTASSGMSIDDINKMNSMHVTASITGKPRVDGDSATVPMQFSVVEQQFSFDLQLLNQGDWCVNDLLPASADGSGHTGEPTAPSSGELPNTFPVEPSY
ncbi:MAG: hypothetical protein ACRDQ1_10155, partial [Sciscionella sp.]